MLYSILKFLHVLGVILLIGNVTISAYWKVLADRTADRVVMAHAQRAVIIGDWLFTIPGIVLILVGGYGMAWVGGLNVARDPWLVWGQMLFLVSGSVWLAILVPLQIRQGRAARLFGSQTPVPADYNRNSRRWLIWGVIATIPLIGSIYVMISKP